MEVLERSLANVGGQFRWCVWWARGKGSVRCSQIVQSLVGHGKGSGAMREEGSDMLWLIILKDDFVSCMKSSLEGEGSEQKEGDLLRGNCRNS